MTDPDDDTYRLRVPPHSTDAEHGVLGALLLDNNAFDRCGDILTDTDFYRLEHKLIYAAIAGLINGSKPADVITVFEQLKDIGKAVDAGGIEYINRLAQSCSTTANVRRHAEIVRENAVRRLMIAAGDQIATAAFNPQGKNAVQLLDDAMRQVMEIGGDAVKDDWVGMDTLIVQQLDEINAAYERGDERDPTFTPTGIAGFDDIFDGGLRAAQFIVLGARPSMGKTSLADEFGKHIAMVEGLPVAKFSMEMQNSEGAQRALASTGSIPGHALRRPKRMNELHWGSLSRAAEKLSRAPIYSNDVAGLNINQIRSKSRALQRRVGQLGLIVVDYIQLMSGLNQKDTRNGQLEEASRGLKALSKELKCPVIALAQVNRSVEKEGESWTKQMPRMSDLKDCGSLEQDADVIIMLVRPCIAEKGLDDEWKDYAQAHVVKQRGGRTGHVNLMFVGENFRYADWPEDRDVPSKKIKMQKGAL